MCMWHGSIHLRKRIVDRIKVEITFRHFISDATTTTTITTSATMHTQQQQQQKMITNVTQTL